MHLYYGANMFLDDVRECPKGFLDARDYEDAVNLLLGLENFNIISLDHDLGEQKTGYDVCKLIVEEWNNGRTDFIKTIYLHTANPVGRDNMFQLLNRYKPNSVKIHRNPMPNNK